MLRKISFVILGLLLLPSATFAQARTLHIGDVELRLGMSRDTAMRALTSKYELSATSPTGFIVKQYDQTKKLWNILGSIGFENNQLSYISRDIDTSGWPNDEGYAVGRAIYSALDASIPVTDSDGAKRADARIVINNNQDVAAGPARGSIRDVSIFLNDRRISITIWDGTDGRSVNASVAIRTKSW